jgi:hypothetical protein
MTNETPAPPELGADFALRVLREADRVSANRLRAWRFFATGTAGLSLVFAGALGVRALDKGSPPPPSHVVIAEAQPLAPDAGSQADALDDLFPDAAPVARFDRTYLSDGSGADDLLAEDTADDDGY